MIASFTHNFIFVKGRKVGGTSLEIVLSSWCSGPDICSLMTKEDQKLRRDYGGRARNFRGPDGKERFFNHMTAEEIRNELPELWDKAFKFTVERHPYEKVVSRAWWEIGRREASDDELNSEIEKAIESGTYINYPYYSSKQRILVDEVWRYEMMWDRLRIFAARWGLPAPDDPPRAKGNYRKDRRPAREVLTQDQRDRIYANARVEFELLGFKR